MAEQDRRAALALLPAASAALVGPAGPGALRGPQQLNPYSYALNNPAALRDPSGLKCEIHFIIGMKPDEAGASALRDDYFSGAMTPEKFDHWLEVNHYSLSYVEGPYAAIHDGAMNVVGVVSAEDVGFHQTSYPQYTTSEALALGVSQIGQILKEKLEASLKVDWNKLQGQEYWDAANNPENYVKR
jgi:hypothetical protein